MTGSNRCDFTSDNTAGVHPDVLAALAEANDGHQPPYGEDPRTARLGAVIHRHFGDNALVVPVFNGTGANVVALESMAPRWAGVVCAETAHLNTDECAAPEHHGLKLITLPATEGRFEVEDLRRALEFGRDRHHPQPGAVSLSQTTELGTCYDPDRVAAITACAHEYGVPVHVDGARIANAATALGASLAELTTDLGVDLVSLGATKNGAMYGDAVVAVSPERVPGLPFLQKAVTQLPSKARFVSAQLLALFEGDLWLRNAADANRTAKRLAEGLVGRGLAPRHPVEANAIFVELPEAASSALRSAGFGFADWDPSRGLVRLMTAFDTEDADVDALLAALDHADAR